MDRPAHPRSFYAATAHPEPPAQFLDHDVQCDVCVIGAGYTGLSAALHLAERGYRVVVLEAMRVGWGASGRNGGQLGTTLRKTQRELESMAGPDDARKLWVLAQDSVATVKGLISRFDIACDLTPGILDAAWKARDMAALEADADHMAHIYDYELEVIPAKDMPCHIGTNRYHGGVLDRNAAHLHPLNYTLGLAQAARTLGATLYEKTPALSIDQTGHQSGKTIIRTPHASVCAHHAVIACNGYLDRLEPRLSGYIMPINNFIIATQPLGEDAARTLIPQNVAVADTKFVIDYYRLSPDHRLLFGGGENYSSRLPRDIAAFVRKPMTRVFPHLQDIPIDYAWSGTLALTLNRMPKFGRLNPNVFYALGYSGQGINMATLAGKLIAQAIAGTAEGFDLMARVRVPRFPGGTWLRYPGLVTGMLFYALRDRLP